MPKTAAANKFEKEAKHLFKRSKNHMLKNTQSWATNRKLMYGRSSDTNFQVNMNGIATAYGLFRSLVSNILVSVPDVFFETTKEDLRQVALCLGDAVSWDFRIGRLQNRMIKALWQNFPYGMGIIAEDMETKFLGPEGDEFIDGQRYFWKNIPGRDVLFDPDGFQIDLDDHRMIWIAYYRSIGDIKRSKIGKEKEYFNLDKIEEAPLANETSKPDRDKQFPYSEGQLPSDKDEMDPDRRQIKIWRCYDRVMECTADIADFDHRLIRYEEWPNKIEIQGILQFPIRILAMNKESDDFYPTPEIDLIKPQLKNKIRLNDQLMTDLTTKIRKYLGLSPYVDQTGMGKLLDPKQPNSFIVTSNTDTLAANAQMPKVDSAADVVSKIPDIEPDPNIVPGMALIDEQLQSILAYGQANRGGLPQIRSAKEATRVADAVQKSLMGRQSDIEMFTQEMAMYHVLLLKRTTPPSAERYYRITDKLSAIATWKKYNPNTIPSEKDLFCFAYVGSSTPQTLDSKRAQFLQEMQVMAPIIKENQMSLIPLLYRYGEVFSVKYMDSFLKNQKGAAMMLYGAMIQAAKLGKNAPPELLGKPLMDMVDAVLSPSEKQMVVQAVQDQQQGPGQGAGGGGDGGGSSNQTSSPDPFKSAGNPSGGVDMGSTQ